MQIDPDNPPAWLGHLGLTLFPDDHIPLENSEPWEHVEYEGDENPQYVQVDEQGNQIGEFNPNDRLSEVPEATVTRDEAIEFVMEKYGVEEHTAEQIIQALERENDLLMGEGEWSWLEDDDEDGDGYEYA